MQRELAAIASDIERLLRAAQRLADAVDNGLDQLDDRYQSCKDTVAIKVALQQVQAELNFASDSHRNLELLIERGQFAPTV